jgi:hypothetical protein
MQTPEATTRQSCAALQVLVKSPRRKRRRQDAAPVAVLSGALPRLSEV